MKENSSRQSVPSSSSKPESFWLWLGHYNSLRPIMIPIHDAFRKIFVCLLYIALLSAAVHAAPGTPLVGTLQSDPARAKQLVTAGITLAEVGLAWDRFEPKQGETNPAYIQEIRAKLAAFRASGMQIVLDFGVHYPPKWVLDLPDARFVNQYGEPYIDRAPGKNVTNGVFNQQIRELQAAYVQRVFAALGSDFKAVRLGWGWYSEMHYPRADYQERKNCYWAFDDIAQGKKPGLPPGISICPEPELNPGTVPQDANKCRLFIEWYFDALRNYHDWQIATVRQHYKGWLTMLYPSWGLRPGQADAAIQAGLAGTTPAERGSDMAQGVDLERLIRGIKDPDVLLHTTWLDPEWGLDDRENPVDWSPAHYLRQLADAHRLKLKVSGENTGDADQAALERTIGRARREKLTLVLWAFEPQLFDGRHASLQALSAALKPRE